MEKKTKKLVVIDGNAIIHRSFHALPPLSTKSGELVNAVYGFASTLLSVIERFQPDYIIATFDLKAPTFRHEEYAEYKATRTKAPDELYAQIDRVKELVRAFNIPIYEKEGFEADDVIGTIVTQSKKLNAGIENIIVTGDLDTLQLVNDTTKVFALRRGITDTVLYGAPEVFERFGLRPDQMIDYKSLRGDASDNIPGVKGIGEKTATTLLQKYDTVEKVYENIAEIKGAVKDKLEKNKVLAFKSKWLATIVLDAPVQLDLEKAVTREFDRPTIVRLFQELNFFSLIKRLPGQGSGDMKASSTDAAGVKDFKFELITPEKMDDFVKLLSEQEEIAITLKTVGPASTRGDDHSSTRGGEKYFASTIQGVAICHKTGRAGYVEYSVESFARLKTIFENEKIRKIGYDLKHAFEVLRKYGIELKNIYWDVMLSAYVLNPGGKVELENIVLEELGEELSAANKKGQLGLEIESATEVAQQICQRADYVFKVESIHQKKIQDISMQQGEKHNLETVLQKIEMPLVKILAEIEMHGIHLNKTIFVGISETIEKRIAILEKSIHQLAGKDFNISSPKQVADVLFETLQIPTDNVKKLKTGFSTASAELTKLRGEHKIIEKIEEYREIFKLKTTYLDSLPKLVDDNSRIHTSFNQAVAATGRLSSSDPNLQNIPIKTDVGQLLRTAFEAEKGFKLVSADYSQIDLRVVAHVSGDKNMIEAFTKGEDIHRATASIINKVSMSQVTEKMRSKAKALNFGIIYGMGVFGFAASAGIDREEAKNFINEYMEKFSGVAKYMHDTKQEAKKNLFVETQLGRRRYIPEINSANFQVQSGAERMAINMPIQGMAADIMKLAMIEAEKVVAEFAGQARTILQVHDELLFEVKEEIAETFAQKIKTAMEQVIKLKVPLVVDVQIGDNWGEI
ncbi:MAG: DNA polymerase I [Candidatus Moranbacteria bacterium]|nr:DNA polymerase I [Candidatus Moranbacteria bacterium]